MWEVFWDEKSLEDLQSLDKATAKKIVNKVSKFLARDPIALGKPLSGRLGGLMRYRFGDYRVIFEVNKMVVQILVLRIGHRKNIYD
jgi:mRNA interferase RelE/StbE